VSMEWMNEWMNVTAIWTLDTKEKVLRIHKLLSLHHDYL
jgi:hypothetical protein